MNITALMTLLVSSLPFLLKMGEKAAEQAASKLGADTWEQAKAVWGKLQPKVVQKGDMKVAVEQVAAKPESPARQSVLREGLEALLAEQPDLASAIADILESNSPTSSMGVQQNIDQNQGQVIGIMQNSKAIGSISGGLSGGVNQ